MDYAAYTETNNSVTLYRLYGTGPVVDIPARINGKTVEILADHLFAGEMSAQCSPEQLSVACLRGNDWIGLEREECRESVSDSKEEKKPYLLQGSPEEKKPQIVKKTEFLKNIEKDALCADKVSVIHIPEGVRQIGNYAFYGLYQLQEISFPSTMQKIGWGMFNSCRMVNRLTFSLMSERGNMGSGYGLKAGAAYAHSEGETVLTDQKLTPPILKEIVDSLSNEIDVIIEKEGKELYRLRFPAYYEEGKENTPARIIEIIYHGTGHQYRNCFLNRVLQFDRYDEIFPLAAAQEAPSTDVHLILNRLRSGPLVKEEPLRRYLDYLRLENSTMMDVILSDREFDPVCTLRMLDEREYFTSKVLDVSIQTASAKGMSAVVSCLMEIRSRRFAGIPGGRKKTRFEL